MGAEQMNSIVSLIDAILRKVKIAGSSEYRMDESFIEQSRERVKALCSKFPMR